MATAPAWIQISLEKNKVLIADKGLTANSFFSRLKGLLGRHSFEQGEALWINSCNNIHMWFMSIPIDVVFVSQVAPQRFQVSSFHSRLRPWALFPIWDFKATDTLELPAGTIQRCDIQVGDLLCLNS